MSAAIPWVLLRGLMRDGRHWGEFPQLLQAAQPNATIHLLDLPGNGLRHRETSPASVPAMAAWVREILRQQGVAPPYRVFAMSLGAMVTVAWAQSHPTELDCAVLVNTSLRPISPYYQRLKPAAWPLLLRMAATRPTAEAAERAILKLTSRHHVDDAALLQQWTSWRLSHPVSRSNALRQLAAAARFRAPRQSPHPRLLLLNGAGDQLVDPRCSAALAACWQCALAIHPTAGHDLPLDDGAWVVQQLQRWAQRSAVHEKGPAFAGP